MSKFPSIFVILVYAYIFIGVNSLNYVDIVTLNHINQFRELSSDGNFTSDIIDSTLYLDNLKANIQSDDLGSSLKLLHSNKLSLERYELKGISNECLSDSLFTLLQLKNKQTWTVTMLDAFFKIPPAVLLGNVHWLGSQDECLTVKVPRNNQSDYLTHHCVIDVVPGNSSDVKVSLNPVYFSLGVCMPLSCTKDDLTIVSNFALSMSPTPLSLVHITCSDDTEEYNGFAIFFFILSGILLFICGVCTLFDVCVYSRRCKAYGEINRDSYEEIGADDQIEGAENEGKPLLNKVLPIKDSFLCDLLLAFSVTRNLHRILTVGPISHQKEGDLSSMHGIRFLSMTWVILGHTYVFGAGSFANPITLIGQVQNFTFMSIYNATVSVDTFFLMSGTLLSYHLLREIEKREGISKVNWWYLYLHRYMRLTIPYAFVLLFWAQVYRYVSFGPLAGIMADAVQSQYWWRSLLYVQNLFTMADDPMGWCWYLANDMQFFVVSPLFVVALYWKKFFGLFLVLLTCVVSWTITGVLTTINNFPLNILTNPSSSGKYMDTIYVKPYCRISPYLIGVILGYFLFKTKLRLRINRSLNLVMWVVAFICCTSVLYGNYEEISDKVKVDQGVDSLYAAVARSVWSLGVAWVIFACANGSGGYVNTILSWSGFVPFSRTTFFAYLLHPIVLNFFYATRFHLIQFDEVYISFIFPGMVILSYGCSLICTVFIESPSIAIEKLIVKKFSKHQ